jgi:hypothetical protein
MGRGELGSSVGGSSVGGRSVRGMRGGECV